MRELTNERRMINLIQICGWCAGAFVQRLSRETTPYESRSMFQDRLASFVRVPCPRMHDADGGSKKLAVVPIRTARRNPLKLRVHVTIPITTFAYTSTFSRLISSASFTFTPPRLRHRLILKSISVSSYHLAILVSVVKASVACPSLRQENNI